MVPHVKVEEVLHELAQTHEQTFAVTAVPDEKEGERLVVLHTLPVDRLQTCFEKLPEAGLANLWLPGTNAFFRVSSLPYLGSRQDRSSKDPRVGIGIVKAACSFANAFRLIPFPSKHCFVE